jgi:hypothetical protein
MNDFKQLTLVYLQIYLIIWFLNYKIQLQNLFYGLFNKNFQKDIKPISELGGYALKKYQ